MPNFRNNPATMKVEVQNLKNGLDRHFLRYIFQLEVICLIKNVFLTV